jgi:hypothetical protein
VLLDEPIDRRMLALTWPMLALAGVAILHAAMGAHADTQLAERSVRATVNTMGAAALCALYRRLFGANWRHVVLSHAFWAIAAHSALVIIMYLMPPLRTFVYRMADTAHYINDTTSFKLGFRIPGLTYGLSQTSVLHLFGVLMAPLVAQQSSSHRQRVLTGLAALVIAGSTLLVGRTGLFLGIFFIPVVFMMARIPRAWTERRALGRMAIPVIAITAVAGVAITLVLKRLPEQFVAYNLSRAGEVLVALTDPSESGTVRAVQAMYLLPHDVTTLLIGEGSLGRDAFRYVASDVGYVRIVFGAGLLGSALLLAPFAGGLAFAGRAWRRDRALAVTTLATLAATLVLHMKEVALLTRNQWSVQALLLCCCLAAADQVIAQRRAVSPMSAPEPSVS